MNGPIDPTAPLTPTEPGPPTTGGPAPGRPRRLVFWIALATLALGGLIGAGLVVLLDGGGGGDGSEVGVATEPTVATTPSPSSTLPATVPAATQPPTADSEAVPPPVTEAPTTTLPRAEFVAPVITRFEITPAEVSCLPGELTHPAVTWATEHATEVTLAVEGLADPIVVSTNGTQYANIRCLPGETPRNIVYVLTATGPGGTTSRSVTVHVTIT